MPFQESLLRRAHPELRESPHSPLPPLYAIWLILQGHIYEMTATLARFPSRTTIRAGNSGAGTTSFSTKSPSILTAFSATFRLASALDAARPNATNSFGRRITHSLGW